MNTQQALRKCFDYFSDSNHQPGFRDGNCVYYANGNNPVKCAIGCLIPVRYQERASEVCGGVESLFAEVPPLRKFFSRVDFAVLYDMQSRHDRWADKGYGLDQLSREDFLDDLQHLMEYDKSN